MAPKVENLIVDAFGKYHDLAKGAFDAFSTTNGGLREASFFDNLQKPLRESGKELLGKIGFDATKILAPLVKNSEGGGFKMPAVTEMLSEFKKLADAPFGHPTLKAAAEIGLGGLAGLFTEAASESYNFFSKARKDRDPSSFKRGQWVAVDMGYGVDDNVYDFNNDFFGKPQVIKGVHRETPEDIEDKKGVAKQINFGFFIEIVDFDKLQVFDLIQLKPIEVDLYSVTPVSPSVAKDLDGNNTTSEIRELFFMKGAPLGMKSDVNVDPGSEVIFGDKKYTVVKAVLDQVLIEDSNGTQFDVSLARLKPGRLTNTQSYAYHPNGGTAGSFNVTLDGFHQGQWVWVSTGRWTHLEIEESIDSSDYELGVVHDISATLVNVFLAMDGKLVHKKQEDLLRVGLDFVDLWRGEKTFQKFRDAAVNGYNAHLFAIGAEKPVACLGLDAFGGNNLIEPPFDAVHCGIGPRRLVALGEGETQLDCSPTTDPVNEKIPEKPGIPSAVKQNAAKLNDGFEEARDRLGEEAFASREGFQWQLAENVPQVSEEWARQQYNVVPTRDDYGTQAEPVHFKGMYPDHSGPPEQRIPMTQQLTLAPRKFRK